VQKVNLVDEADEENDQVPYVIAELPSSVKDLKKLLKKHSNAIEDESRLLNLILCRLRDYHDPMASLKEDETQIAPWNSFVLILLQAWLNEKKIESKEVFENHIKEVLGQAEEGAQTIIRYV
jgi:hypothetical protein